MADQMGTPAMDPNAQGDDQEESQGLVVCITVQPDGTFQVYEQGEEDETQTADNIDDALTAAKQMIMEEGSEDEGSEQDSNEPMQPDQAKAAWNQMAAKRDKTRGM